MKISTYLIYICGLFLMSPNGYVSGIGTPTVSIHKTQLAFTENKGQIHDQYHKPRPDVLFGGTDGSMTFYLRSNGISYQLNKIDSKKNDDGSENNITTKVPNNSIIYRLDINWLNANQKSSVQKGMPLDGSANYYQESCPGGALNVKSYEDVTYQNIYKGVDLKWYQKNGHLKYDYILSAGANYKQIQLEIKGADKIVLNKNGELSIETPLGEIIEQAPYVIQNNKPLKAKWVVKRNIVTFEIEDIDPNESFTIDPLVRTWGTYYGGGNADTVKFCTTDNLNNVYICGVTSSSANIATVGSHQSIIGQDSERDAFVSKFNASGTIIWATYYGSSNAEWGNGCAVDGSGNVFLVGQAGNSTGSVIATPGSHQPTWSGTNAPEAFIVKFNSSGVRQWGTWYGGSTGNEYATCCAVNASGDLYVGGYASSTGTAIATVGSHQPSNSGGAFDGFLVKFNSAGVRQWGTFYGGSGLDAIHSCIVNSTGNVIVSGQTSTPTNTLIATSGAHQTAYGVGTSDAFLAVFNSSGVRQWGTYYGGNGSDIGYGCSVDASGNCYLSGSTNSGGTVAISTPGSHQPVQSSGFDAFLAKFNSTGVRQWGTYYGGLGLDRGYGCATDAAGNCYLTGYTSSAGTVIATPGSHQPNGGGSNDAFIVKFDPSGVRQFGSFYGGTGNDYGFSTAIDNSNNIYIGGSTSTAATNTIASANGHQTTYIGSNDGFLVQLFDCVNPPSPTNTTPLANQTRCPNITTTLSATGSGTVSWFANPTGGSALATGTNYITSPLGVGTYTFYAELTTCASSTTRTPVTLTVVPNPVITVNSGTICSGKTFTMLPGGGVSYTYSSGSSTVSPLSNSTYTVTGINSLGCTNTAVSSVSVNLTPTISASGGFVCPGGSFTINPSGANTYTYSSGGPVVTPTATSNYTVMGSSAQGCTATPVVITVTYTNNLIVNISGANTVCSGQPIILTANGASSYSWSTSANTNTISITPTVNTTYTVLGASGTCSNIASHQVTVNPNPTVTAVTNQSVLCPGQSATLTASGAVNYTWNPSGSGSSIIVSPTVDVTYTVTGTNANGCSSSAVITQSASTCTGIDANDNEQVTLALYPNPNQGEFFIRVSDAVEVKVVNILGQELNTIHLKTGENKILMEGLAAGIYFAQIGTNKRIKFIKE